MIGAMTESTQQPDRFARFCASLDTNGGHIIISLWVIAGGIGTVVGSHWVAEVKSIGEGLVLAASTSLWIAMKGKGAENHDTDAPQSARIANAGEPIKTVAPTIEAQTVEHVDVAAPNRTGPEGVLGPVSSGPKEPA
jgi:hypothetical protein